MKGKKEYQRHVRIRKEQLREKATMSELIFKDKLNQAKIRNFFQRGFFGETFCIVVDFFIPRKMVIEIDGKPKTSDYEIQRENWLINKRGFRLLRLTNQEAIKITHEKLYKIIHALKFQQKGKYTLGSLTLVLEDERHNINEKQVFPASSTAPLPASRINRLS